MQNWQDVQLQLIVNTLRKIYGVKYDTVVAPSGGKENK